MRGNADRANILRSAAQLSNFFSQNYSQRSDGNLQKFDIIADIFLQYLEAFKNRYFAEDLWITTSTTANWN